MKQFIQQIGRLYRRGKDSCLLNMLSVTKEKDNPFSSAICATFKDLQEALSAIALETGVEKKEALVRAENVLIALHGALVLSRGTGSTGPFRRMQLRLPMMMLG